MKKAILTLLLSALALQINPLSAVAEEQFNREYTARTSPDDYLLKSFDPPGDSIFEQPSHVIDLGADLAIGSDCGRVDFRGTLRAALKNLLDARYFGNLGRNIIAASPLLLTCYFSPTWCAVLKHTRLSANFLSQLRLDQCSLIDKFVDSRTEDFYRERQNCVRNRIKSSSGNLEEAMNSCRNIYGVPLTNWAGSRYGAKVTTNRLIEGSAKWAGLDRRESGRALDLIKSFVGDTVVARGQVSVDYGSRRKPISPETELRRLQRDINGKLCDGLLRRVQFRGRREPIDRLLAETDLADINARAGVDIIDRQTIEALVYLPYHRRKDACRKLASAIGLTIFSTETGDAIDLLTAASQNPNLPPGRKDEIERKRRVLKDSVEMTLRLQDRRNTPLSTVLAEIHEASAGEVDRLGRQRLSRDDARQRQDLTRSVFFDCADSVMCERRR